MKHYVTLLSAILLSVSLYAQQHLSILDVPIEGSLENMIHELTLRGLEQMPSIAPNIASLRTEHNGQPIDFLVVASENGHQVYRVVVLTQSKKQWRWLRNEYNYYKKALTKQYGKPNTVEVFMAPYDTKKKLRRRQLQALNENRAQWVSFFNATTADNKPYGTVMLQISPEGPVGRVIIVYEDKAGSDLFAPENK